ncbi:hypothetical protein LZQ00_03870 [Sphingobacterium sp. SRCM116780]|uniref:hypothetical protein n=1 Tax=Sphingobacterium sp. SRCM116780 TaxID=2907623 RepID=UPI001F4817F0|nr:hypothetical protein [Sphingobacterium sp. SRCM116780]UIR56958.1 hypothetical protein LZQ00_03870 [Sphingobacterium sp. SRCM116780]
MFDKATYIKALQDNGIYTSEEADNLTEKMKLKHSLIKHGPNVVHLEYYGGLLDDRDIVEIESTFKGAGLELSRFDKSGIAYANIDDYMLHIALFISSPAFKLILEHVGKNTAWEAVKATAIKVWRKVRNKNNSSSMSGQVKKTNVGLRIGFNNGQLTDFKLDGELSEETILMVIDKVFDYSLKQSQLPSSQTEMPDFVVFDEKLSELRPVNVMEELRKKAEFQSAKRRTDLANNSPTPKS